MIKRHFSAINLVISAILLSLFPSAAHSFISREYTLQEVLDACTNVAFGKTESVDGKRQRVIVKLEEDIKGKSEFSHIRINVAVGQRTKETSPDMLMKKFEVGLPVIIFYQTKPDLKGLGHVSGTWFQIFGDNNPDRSRAWWNFTHIEIHMHRTFSGSTKEFQEVVRAMLSGKKWPMADRGDVKTLVLTGNGVQPVQGAEAPGTGTATAEFLTLRKISKVGRWRVAYQETKDKSLPELNDAHILWIGVDELGKDGYRLDEKSEKKIKRFVRRGGVVIVSSQDSDPPDRLCGTGWIPEPITGVEEQARRDFEPTKDGGDIFKKPRSIEPGTIHLDDTWTGWNGKYKILATTNDGKNIALAMLRYGKGMYLVTALQNENQADAEANAPLMENIMDFSVKWLKLR